MVVVALMDVILERVVGPGALQLWQRGLRGSLPASKGESAAQIGTLSLVRDAAQLPLLDVVTQDGAGLVDALVEQAVAGLQKQFSSF